MEARIGGNVDDFNSTTLRGTGDELHLREWFGAYRRREGATRDSRGDPAELRARRQVDQLTQRVALIGGRQHTLPGFA